MGVTIKNLDYSVIKRQGKQVILIESSSLGLVDKVKSML
jgi:hypothetical protein